MDTNPQPAKANLNMANNYHNMQNSMNNNDAQMMDYGRKMIRYTLANNKPEVIKLLKDTGIDVPKDSDKKTLHFIVLKAAVESKSFKNNFASLLAHVASGNKQPFNVVNTKPKSSGRKEFKYETNNFNGSGNNGVIGDLDKVCNSPSFANQDGEGDGSEVSSSDSTSNNNNVQFKDILGKVLDLTIAYVGSQGSKGISDEVNNEAKKMEAERAAKEKARKQTIYFTVFLVSAVAITGGIIYYTVKKQKTK